MEFNLFAATGVSLSQLPKAVRDEEGRADTGSLAALFGDRALDRDPSGLLVGTAQRYAQFFDVSVRHAQDLVPKMHTHQLGSFHVTLVQSAQWFRQQYPSAVSSAHAIGGRASGRARARSDVSAGTSATARLEAILREEIRR